MTTDFLRRHADELQAVARNTTERAERDPSDFWTAVVAENQRQAVLDLRRRAEIVDANALSELIDLRFIGPRADGAIPLDSFLKIADPLSKAWKAAAFRLRHGVSHGRVSTDIADILNLKLAGMAPGSTHIFITGNALEDTTGDNLLRNTLVQTFRLLQSNNDEFYDAVDAVGGRAAQCFGDAFRAISAAGLSAEFSWNSGSSVYRWRGTSDELSRIQTLLAAVSESDSFEETISGVVSGIFEAGRLDIRTAEGKVKVRFSMDQTPEVQHLSIATPTSLRVFTTRYTDPVTQREIYKRQLLQRAEPDLIG